jgi:hypothetical protein
MSIQNRLRMNFFRRILCGLSLIAVVLSAGCLPQNILPKSNPVTPSPSTVEVQTAVTTPRAQVTFRVKIPAQTPAGAKVIFSVLDEVTGLPYNSTSYQMQADGNGQYKIQLPFMLGAVVSYCYELDGNPRIGEYTPGNEPVRYRLAVVPGPETVDDAVSAWKDMPFSGQVGQLTGAVTDTQSSAPVAGAIVVVAGVRAITGSDGAFTIPGLPEGTHNIVVITTDGHIQPFQQGATIVGGKITDARIQVITAPTVNVTFSVSVPKENVVGLPVRMAGNLATLGDTFSDLSGGVSVQASRTPLLTQKPDGKYELVLKLPVGMDLRYKYTLGDGFWNAELTNDGKFNLRELVVPDHDTTIQDVIETWRSPNLAPVTFDIQAPETAGEMVSVQFSPFVWMEPLPMWAMGGNRWVYILYSPQHMLGQVKYRFCHGDKCEGVDVASGAEPTFTPSSTPQTIQKTISAWQALAPLDLSKELALQFTQ